MLIGVAIIGSGSFAREEHLPAVQACLHLELKAIYSRTLKSAKALSESAGQVDVYSDDHAGNTYIDLLLQSDINAVIIALPITSQIEYIMAALRAGKHVLSEKPIAQNIRDAQRLLKFYHSQIDLTKTTWGVAENFRFKESFKYAAQEVQNFGKIIMFQVVVSSSREAGSKWLETDWRQNPAHQGGFIHESGVHFTAAARLLMPGYDNQVIFLASYTTLLQEHLSPVDSIKSIWCARSGARGTVSMTWGTTSSEIEYNVACENGTVKLRGTKVVSIEPGGYSLEQEFASDDSGVEQEIAAWAQSIIVGEQDPLRAPEEGLADLELIEKMLTSGARHGTLEYMRLQCTST